ncbi:hypothetical protein PISMIDRAFT_109475 [Pisolithus microcarpus 441]|uniref:Retroviral polymerase SH3-like domain-containing protein n=1 Tax=Pisolithus microcarpus 441 TaxID=765257 RepID=A0A0C9ZEM3_9AGAM|nr:hypothetical protein PISMIDRAFT_109475 [Pisolithus microcarpus 441]
MLYHKPPNLAKTPVWGCHVKVHDTSSSKLDMQARDRHWVGFDPESDSHRIYWPDTCSIGIKWSVTFEHQEVTKPSSVSLEGENEATNGGGITHQEGAQPQASGISDPLGNNFETPPPQPCCSNHQCFESDYMRCLQEGEGTCDGQITLDYMKQLQENSATLAFEEELAQDGNDSDPVYAMVAGTSEAEGLNPSTVHEAKSCSDWPKWHDTIAAELKSLSDVHTWDVVECPKGANIVGCKWVFKIK